MFSNRAERLSHLITDNHLLELARLLDREVKLTAKIADPTLIDRETIKEVIEVAKKLAANSCPLQLVDLDETLDIAQIFCSNPDVASNTLENLQAELKKTDSPAWKDPVWTARVAAVLAYFSALK